MTKKQEFQFQRWKLLIDEKQKSGMKIKDFCEVNGVTKDAYYYWLHKLREENFDTAIQNLPNTIQSGTFVEIRPSGSICENNLQLSQPVAIIQKESMRIELLSNASAVFIKNLLEAVHYA